MKKLLLLAVALVMSVCSWAQVNLASGVYEIENVSNEGGDGIGRGYLVDFTGYTNGPSIGGCPWSNYKSFHPVDRNDGTTTCSYWYLYNDEGTYYIFSLSTLNGNTAPKFLQLGTPSNTNSVKLARWSSDKVALEVVDNPNATNSVGIRNVGVTANNGYLSMACGTKSTDGSIKVDALTDGGAKLALKSVAETELSAEQKAVMTAGIAICEKAPSYPTFDAEKQYTFHATASQRGYLAYNPAESTMVGLADVTLSAQYAGMHPTSTTEGVGINWKVETTAPGKVILYNTTSEKYLGKSGAVAVWVEKANAQVLEVSEKSEGVYNFKVDNVYLVAACGYAENQGAVRFNSYEQAADLTVAEVEGTEPGPKPENTTLSVSLFNGSDEIALSAEEATSVATATGIKFTYENVSSDCFGYSCYINQEGAEDPLYIGGGEIGEGTDTDTFDAAINFVKGEQYQVVVSFILDGPSFTFNITGTYEEEEGPTDEPTLSFTDNTDNTFTVTPSSATEKWYAAIVPASIFDEVSEEEKEYVAGGYLSQYTVELLTSLDEAYVGTKTFDAAELYAEQNEEAELEAGEYFVVAGYVQGVSLGEITMVQPKTVQWFAYTVAGEEGPTDEPTLSFTDNEDNTFTVTPSSATEKWYAAIVPASIFDEVSEEEKEYVAGGYLSQYTVELLTSLDEAYVGTKTLDAAELYAEQNEEAELEAGEYFVVAGYVQGVALGEITMVQPKTVQWFAYTQHDDEEGEEKELNTTTKFFTGAELRAEVAAVGIAKVGLVNVTSTSNKYVNGKAYNGTPASANNTLAGVRAPQADEILEVVAVEGGYTLRQADAAEGEGYLKCAAGGNFTTSTAAEANVWKIASEGEDGFDVKGTITNFDDLYTDINKSINPNMVRFVSQDQYLNGQNRDSQGGLRGGTGAWSFVYVYNANYIEAPTGVGTVLAPVATESIFNLQGQRIVKLQKGINIVGGKKVIK